MLKYLERGKVSGWVGALATGVKPSFFEPNAKEKTHIKKQGINALRDVVIGALKQKDATVPYVELPLMHKHAVNRSIDNIVISDVVISDPAKRVPEGAIRITLSLATPATDYGISVRAGSQVEGFLKKLGLEPSRGSWPVAIDELANSNNAPMRVSADNGRHQVDQAMMVFGYNCYVELEQLLKLLECKTVAETAKRDAEVMATRDLGLKVPVMSAA